MYITIRGKGYGNHLSTVLILELLYYVKCPRVAFGEISLGLQAGAFRIP